MRTTVIFHRLAVREYRDSRKWYAARSASVAERFRAAVDIAVDRVASQTDSLPILSGEFRWVRVRRFPYVLVFKRRSPDVVMIVAVAHTSRRPGYWRRRK
jgi:plasmid stabilization system protein ParE